VSFLKLTGAVRVLLAASAVFAASSQVARAETVFLKCGDTNTFTVDLLKSTVDNCPASITPLSIKWHVPQDLGSGKSGVTYWHIDRVAATLTNYFTVRDRNGVVNTSRSTTDSRGGSAFRDRGINGIWTGHHHDRRNEVHEEAQT
jgi:hypothetical protein